jgi:hypothetical protein
MRDRKLDSLAPAFKPFAIGLLARCTEAGIAIAIVETRRTAAQHQEDLASGHSFVLHSKHQDGLAIDVAPFETYQLHGDKKIDWSAGTGPEHVLEPWATMGTIGESLGMKWGGRWHKPYDAGHFEFP